ncbi:MAG: hypothetical protein Q7W16_00005 [Coriobacteriia bacterium]|nr:hypothetical protein [Coriobacteriia bacterium]
MKHRIITSVAGVLLIASLVASPAASAAPGSGSAGVTVTVSVAARVDYTLVDHDHIDVRSNAPWRLTLVSAQGVSEITGPRTGSTPVRLAVPEGTTDYFVTLE